MRCCVHRLLERGERVRMHLVLTPRELPDAASANVVAEMRGSEKPDEIVLIGAHLDSWDLGTGAIDDGSGVAMVMETHAPAASELDLKPKRTIRAVLFMNEENGLRGGRAYFDEHKLERHAGAIETDAGAAAPTGFTTTLKGDALAALESRTRALAAVNAHRFEIDAGDRRGHAVPGRGGRAGLRARARAAALLRLPPLAGRHAGQSRPHELAQDTAAVAALAWILANE